MTEAVMHMSEKAPGVAEKSAAPRVRTRTCVGCNERVETDSPAGDDLVRLILGENGEIAVDPKGGGFGRGAYVHARRPCLERAAKAGLMRATKGNAKAITMGASPPNPRSGLPVGGDGGESARISADALARAIESSMDRRIEGLLAAALRSKQLARGANAVVGACQRGEADLVLVATDAAAAADLGEVRRAVAAGRAVAWSTKERLGRLVASRPARSMLGPSTHLGCASTGADTAESVGVIAITSRTLAEELSRTVRTAAQLGAADTTATRGRDGGFAPKPPLKADRRERRERGQRGVRGPVKDHSSDR